MNTENCFEQGMLRKEIIDKEKAKKSLIVSRTFIKKAEELLDLKSYSLILFCSYTAMFHAARFLYMKIE